MKLRLAGIVLLSLTGIGCRSSDGVPARDSSSPQRTATPSMNGAPTKNDVWATRPDDCPVDTIPIHSDPAALIKEHYARDQEGTVADDRWNWGALTCVELTTSDWWGVISTPTFEQVRATQDTAVLLVRFRVHYSLGYDSSGTVPRLVAEDRAVVDTAVVVRTRRGWRIAALDGGAHLSPATALAHLTKLDAADRARLKALRSRPGT